MKKYSSTKKALLSSVLSLALCALMLVATTFAWFTSSVVNSNNLIKAGSFEVELWKKLKPGDTNYNDEGTDPQWGNTDDMAADNDIKSGPIFSYELWEPGYTSVAELQVRNKGTLALKYKIVLTGLTGLIETETKGIENVLFVKVYVGNTDDGIINYAATPATEGSLAEFADGIKPLISNDCLLPYNDDAPSEHIDNLKIEITMQESGDLDTDYQDAQLPRFSIQLSATQASYESDDYGNNQYDENADLRPIVSLPQNATVEDLQAAISSLSEDGGTIRLPENFVIDSANTTLTAPAGKSVTIVGDGSTTAVKRQPGTTNNHIFKLNTNSGNSEFIIKGIVFNDSSSTKAGAAMLHLDNAATSTVIFDGCIFNATNNRMFLIDQWNQGEVIIENCEFTGNARLNINGLSSTVATRTITIRNNIFISGNGAQLTLGESVLSNITIEGNTFNNESGIRLQYTITNFVSVKICNNQYESTTNRSSVFYNWMSADNPDENDILETEFTDYFGLYVDNNTALTT